MEQKSTTSQDQMNLLLNELENINKTCSLIRKQKELTSVEIGKIRDLVALYNRNLFSINASNVAKANGCLQLISSIRNEELEKFRSVFPPNKEQFDHYTSLCGQLAQFELQVGKIMSEAAKDLDSDGKSFLMALHSRVDLIFGSMTNTTNTLDKGLDIKALTNSIDAVLINIASKPREDHRDCLDKLQDEIYSLITE